MDTKQLTAEQLGLKDYEVTFAGVPFPYVFKVSATTKESAIAKAKHRAVTAVDCGRLVSAELTDESLLRELGVLK